MNTRHYILAGRDIIPTINLMAWAVWFEGPERFIAHARVRGYRVSTVFMGLDQNVFDKGPPLLFETMVFKGHDDVLQLRAYTYEQAKRIHQLMVRDLSRPPRYRKRDILPQDEHPTTARVYCLRPPVS